jgi:orotidine-5'-phosphate decarboxylase
MSTHRHFADRWFEASDAAGAPVCVGIDPVYQKLPAELQLGDPVKAVSEYSLAVIEAVAGVVPAVKPQLACYERYGSRGFAAYESTVAAAKQHNLLVIADGKRGDIGLSSAHYAAGLLGDTAVGSGVDSADPGADALTVNAYLGMDGLDPFIQTASERGAGLFALVRTSNPGGDALQSLNLADGGTVAEGVARLIAETGQGDIGESGYSLLGAVVGATKPADAIRLRELMPQQLFLVPGYGAQGGSAEDVRACLNPDGRGAIITASRSVIYAYHNAGGGTWQQQITDAAKQLRDEIAGLLK